MKPVYLRKDKYHEIVNYISNNTGDSSPASLLQEIEELVKYKILVKSPDEDKKILNFIQSKIPEPSISVCYFILSEQCNLACKYCFLGNNNPEKRKTFSLNSMSKETAEKALSFFIRQIELSSISNPISNPINNPVIIFYGGEPLLNFEVLEYVAIRVQELKSVNDCLKNIELSVITNGILLDDFQLIRLKELNIGIAISIDGCTEKSNAHRVDVAGNSIFKQIINVLDRAKLTGAAVSLSVSLTEETIKDKNKILELINNYNIKSLGFNILMSDENYKLCDEYNEKAAQFIIDMFIELRQIGVYEDRIMRKLKAFSNSQVYFSDCAATSGSQIVIAPDGAVGICHGCLSDRKYFVTTIEDNDFDARSDLAFKEWANLTPLNKNECLNCEALGICGGGCPINALHSKPGNTIQSLDKRFCAHAKKTLEFFIKDLYRIISN